jgi:flagellar basal-body rod modification protein FlgD
MDISAASSSASAAASGVASAKLSENFDTFLTLLTTQLKNQDPLEPTDSNEFVAQLVQFSQVEQSIASNKSLEKLIDLQTTNQAAAAVGYIGNSVEAAGNIVPLQNGKATFSYALGQKSTSTVIVISDLNDNVVHSAAGNTDIGKHTFTWDGLDRDGQAMPEGSYKITIRAVDGDNEQLDVPTSIYGKVTGVASGDDGVLLSIGSVNIPLTDVLSVSQPTDEDV